MWKQRGFHCLDDPPADTILGGVEDGEFYHDISIVFAPCNLSRASEGAIPTADCTPDLAKQIEYLGSPELAWYINYERYDQSGYGESSTVKESKIRKAQFDPQTPSFLNLYSASSILNDETGLFQLG